MTDTLYYTGVTSSISLEGLKNIISYVALETGINADELTSHQVAKYFRDNNIYPHTCDALLPESYWPSDPFDDSVKMPMRLCDLFTNNPPEIVITYTWTMPLMKVVHLLTTHDFAIWIDIFFVNQNSKDIIAELSHANDIYSNSKWHLCVSVDIIDRCWCVFELYVRIKATINDKAQKLSLHPELESHNFLGPTEYLLTREEIAKGLDAITADYDFMDRMQATVESDKINIQSNILTAYTKQDFNRFIRNTLLYELSVKLIETHPSFGAKDVKTAANDFRLTCWQVFGRGQTSAYEVEEHVLQAAIQAAWDYIGGKDKWM
jgi:hypothetical protein